MLGSYWVGGGGGLICWGWDFWQQVRGVGVAMAFYGGWQVVAGVSVVIWLL